MKQGTKRLASMALALMFIVGSFVVYFELTQPAYKGLEELQGERKGNEQFLAEQKPIVDTVQKLIQNYTGENAMKIRAAISQTLPLGEDMSSSLVQLEGLVRGSGLTLTLLSPQGGRSTTIPPSSSLAKPVGTLVFRVGFNGTYSQVKEFLSRLEDNILLFDVQSISIQPAVRPGIDSFNGTVEVVSYYQQL